MRDSLPSELRAFLYSCIESIEQIELLMLMRGSEHFRTARDVADALREPIGTARGDLETLAARGLLDVLVGEETAYRYRPKTVELGRYLWVLVAQHQRHVEKQHVAVRDHRIPSGSQAFRGRV